MFKSSGPPAPDNPANNLTPSPAVLAMFKDGAPAPVSPAPVENSQAAPAGLTPSPAVLAMFGSSKAAPTDTAPADTQPAGGQNPNGYGNTDVVGGIENSVGDIIHNRPVQFLQDAKDTAEAFYHNIGDNNLIVNTVKTLTGTSDYDVKLKSLTDQQNDIQQRLAVLRRAADNGHADPAMQRVYEQANLGISQQLSAMAEQQIKDSWRGKDGLPNALSQVGSDIHALIKGFQDSPGSAFHALGNSLFADPELFALGPTLNAVKGVKVAEAASKAGEAEAAAETLGTDAADPAQAWTMQDNEVVANAQLKLVRGMAAAQTIKSGLKNSGVDLGSVAAQAAIFTPLNIVNTISKQGSVSRGEALNAAVSGVAMSVAIGAAQFAMGKDLSVDELMNNGGTAHGSLMDSAKDLGLDLSKPAKVSSGTDPAVPPIEGSNPVAAAVHALAEAGGSHNPQDFLDGGVEEHQLSLNLEAKDGLQKDLDEHLASGKSVSNTVVLPTGVLHHVTNSAGNVLAEVRAAVSPDGLRVVSATGGVGKEALNASATSHAVLADGILAKGGNLTSDWAVDGGINADNGQAAIWTKELPQRGYIVRKSESAMFDPVENRWLTTDGSPVWRVVGKDPNAPSTEELGISNDVEDLRRQAGRIDPKLLMSLGVAGVGAAGFAYGEQRGGFARGLEDAFMAALTMVVGPRALRGLSAGMARKGVASLSASDAALGTLDKLNGELNTLPVLANQFKNHINALVPDSSNLYKNLVKDPAAKPMTANEQKAYDTIRSTLNAMGSRAQAAGVIKNMVSDYFTRWWKPVKGSPMEKDWNKINLHKGRTLKPGTDGLQQAHALGLVPITTNVGDLMEQYILGIHRSTLLNETAGALKQARDSSGELLLQPSSSAPKNYMRLHGMLSNMKAHPDIAVLTNMLYDTPEASMLGHAYDAVNYALKRTALSFSLFHAKNLAMQYVMANGRPLELGSAFSPNSPLQQALKFGGDNETSNYIKFASRSGLTFAVHTTSEDLNNDVFYKSLGTLSDKLDNIIPHAGAVTRGIAGISHLNDKIAFQLGQNYFKFQTFSRVFESDYKAAINRHMVHPDKYAEPDKDAIARRAAQVANDLFGSQNYYNMIRNMKQGWIQQIAGEIFNPSGRKWLQRAFLAPDWTISVARSFSRAVTAHGEDLPSTLRAKAPYARYLLGAAGFTAAAAGVQQLVTGKWPWETDTPLGYIGMPDGSRMQWDKQIAEFEEYFSNPRQVPLNKLAEIPKLVGENLADIQYLNWGGAPQIYKENAPDKINKLVMFNLKGILPIAGQQELQGGERGGISSFVGFPVYPPHHVNKRGLTPMYRMKLMPNIPKVP